MRTSSVEDCIKVLAYYGIDPCSEEAIDVGGTPIVWLDTKPDTNPLLKIVPRLIFLDKGFNVKYFKTNADIIGDFLDPAVAGILQNRFKLVFCFDTLEHVSNPFVFSANLLRIAKPGGYIYVSTLFYWGYHPSPEDFFRFSPEGLQECFRIGTHDSAINYKMIWGGWESDRRRVGILIQKEGREESVPYAPLVLEERNEWALMSKWERTKSMISRLSRALK